MDSADRAPPHERARYGASPVSPRLDAAGPARYAPAGSDPGEEGGG